jgi:hypothetical protein
MYTFLFLFLKHFYLLLFIEISIQWSSYCNPIIKNYPGEILSQFIEVKSLYKLDIDYRRYSFTELLLKKGSVYKCQKRM